MTKDNIMKITDGLFHNIFDEIAAEYPEIESNHMIIDIGSARIASRPTDFDVVVTLNLYGDIISDIAAEVSGSIGMAGSSNIGAHCSMFEAVHGSAPDIAGRDIANPSGLLLAAVMMLVHLGKPKVAETIHNAWLRTIEDGIHTKDISSRTFGKVVGTREFAQAVIDRLGMVPKKLEKVKYPEQNEDRLPTVLTDRPKAKKVCVGVDVFLNWDEHDRNPEALGERLKAIETDELKLKLITNRGVKVYPDGNPETLLTDHWRCRFVSTVDRDVTNHIPRLLSRLYIARLDAVKTENLYTFDGVRGYSQAQGE
jgi:isocitrate dehydrogenase